MSSAHCTIGYGSLKVAVRDSLTLPPNISDIFFRLRASFCQRPNIPDTFFGDKISKVQFHHEGSLSESRYFELFSQLAMKSPHTKNQLSLRPPSCLFKNLA